MAKNISQAEFATLFDLARASIGAYEEGRSEPKIDTIIQIANTFRLSIDVLLRRELTVGEIYSFGLVNEKLNKAHKLSEKGRAPTLSQEIALVKGEDFVNYIVRRDNQDFIRELPIIAIPKQDGKDLRAFEMQGSEMEYHQQGLHHGDILIARKHDMNKIHKLTNKVLVVISEARIIIRRLGNTNPITLICDDPNYPAIEMKDIEEIWEVIAVYSTYLNAPSLLEERVLRLEKLLEEVRKD